MRLNFDRNKSLSKSLRKIAVLAGIVFLAIVFSIGGAGCGSILGSNSQGSTASTINTKNVAAIVNGEPITMGEFLAYVELDKKSSRALNKPLHTEQALLKQLILTKVIEQNAKKTGVAVSDKEIEVEIDKRRTAYKTMPDETKQVLLASIKRMGYSPEEYWKSDDLRSNIRRSLLITKLEEKVVKTEIEKTSLVKTSDNARSKSPGTDKEPTSFNDYIQKLVKEAKIKVIYKPAVYRSADETDSGKARSSANKIVPKKAVGRENTSSMEHTATAK